ncbi:MAG: S8 family serine peptidase [Candidatus Helarchaeota archaeon]
MRLKYNMLYLAVFLLLGINNGVYGDITQSYHSCGILVTESDCLLFHSENQDQLILELANTASYQAGDQVCVSGLLELGFYENCQSADGYLHNNTIYMSFVDDQIIIETVDDVNIELIIDNYQGEVIDSIDFLSTYLTQFPGSLPIEIIIEALNINPNVKFAHANYIMGFPETFQISQQFPDENQPPLLEGESPPIYYEDGGCYSIGNDSANIIAVGTDIVIAVIDNGIDLAHPLFENDLILPGYDFVDDDYYPDEVPGNAYGHGTFVSGIIRRIAPGAKLLPFRVFDEDGYAGSFDVAQAIYTALIDSSNVKIINMSFGTYHTIDIIEHAINSAIDSGIIIVSSPGNDNTSTPTYPSSYDDVISVSAIDSLDLKADFSNYGNYIDVCAPGVKIYSSLAGEYQWGYWSGTSFSAPMAAGICALVLEIYGTISPSEMDLCLKETADRNLLWGTIGVPDDEYGFGRLNAYNVVLHWKRGDVDNNNQFNILDISFLINYLYKNGTDPDPVVAVADFDCSGGINVLDISALINYLYKDEPRPVCHD